MKRIRSFFVVFFLVFCTASILARGAGDSARTSGANGPLTITITYATGNQLTADLMHARVEGFMRENPQVTLVEKLSNEGSYLDAIRTLDAVGEFPDLIEMRDTPLFARAGKLGELPAD
ncbi:MAG: hypothetical protein LBT87_00190, partial [Treponema sp.]|nr:hypothetical protein [Treponema sp.]